MSSPVPPPSLSERVSRKGAPPPAPLLSPSSSSSSPSSPVPSNSSRANTPTPVSDANVSETPISPDGDLSPSTNNNIGSSNSNSSSINENDKKKSKPPLPSRNRRNCALLRKSVAQGIWDASMAATLNDDGTGDESDEHSLSSASPFTPSQPSSPFPSSSSSSQESSSSTTTQEEEPQNVTITEDEQTTSTPTPTTTTSALEQQELSLANSEESPTSETPRKKLASEKTKDEQRMDVINEIVASEERYVEGLHYLDHCYISPLKLILALPTNNPKEMITMKEFGAIFQSIFVIRKVNEFLLSMLKALLAGEAKENEDSIGKIFLSVGPMLKTYSDYVNNYDSIVRNVKELRKNRPKFDGFMTAVENRALRGGKVHFFSYMVSPVQRIPRYNLLLRELIRFTEEEHDDYGNLSKALDLTQEISAHVNSRLHLMDQQKKAIDLQRTIPNIEQYIGDFLHGGRRILFDGPVYTKKKSLVSDKSKEYVLYLMNDLFLLVRKNKYQVHGFLNETPQLWVFADPAHNEVFTLVTQAQVYRFHAESAERRNAWVDRITDAISESQKLITGSKENMAKAVLHRRIGRNGDPVRIVMAQTTNVSGGCEFNSGDHLIVHYEFNDGTGIVSLARDNTLAVRVPVSCYREMAISEKLACEYITNSERQKLSKEFSNSGANTPRSCLSDESADNDDNTDDVSSDVMDPSPRPLYGQSSNNKSQKIVPALPTASKAQDSTSPREKETRRDSLTSRVRNILSPRHTEDHNAASALKSPRHSDQIATPPPPPARSRRMSCNDGQLQVSEKDLASKIPLLQKSPRDAARTGSVKLSPNHLEDQTTDEKPVAPWMLELKQKRLRSKATEEGTDPPKL